MRKVNENNTSNVIEVSFNQANPSVAIEEYEAHLGSLVDLCEDPVTELLNEFDQQEEEVKGRDLVDQHRVSYDENPIMMGEKLMQQIKQIQEKTSRISYYLTEMNFED